VPASVRSARLVLADGRTIQSRVIRVPRRDGGPAGIYAQELRGSTSHAVSLVELNAGGGVVLTFSWSLSIGCAPHPYAILYAILLPPGKSVMAQTPQGAVALNVVPVEPRVHAKGPLVYGVFSALPSELTVVGANGSTVYTENLQAKAAEAAQFCEGYAEPWWLVLLPRAATAPRRIKRCLTVPSISS
jgi:hypothetical protein